MAGTSFHQRVYGGLILNGELSLQREKNALNHKISIF
jgi:hypothetical protein